MTNYQLAKLVNYRLEELGLPKVTPQQVYGARKGQPDLTSPEAIMAFVESFCSKRKSGTRAKSVNAEEFFKAIRAQKDAEAKKAAEAPKALNPAPTGNTK